MKRYLLFTATDYQATEQGWDGFRGDFDTIGEIGIAIDGLARQDQDRFQIVDTEIKKIIERGRVSQWQKVRKATRHDWQFPTVAKES